MEVACKYIEDDSIYNKIYTPKTNTTTFLWITGKSLKRQMQSRNSDNFLKGGNWPGRGFKGISVLVKTF